MLSYGNIGMTGNITALDLYKSVSNRGVLMQNTDEEIVCVVLILHIIHCLCV